MPERPDTSHGFGRALVAVYAVFALAASARSIVQLIAEVDSDTVVPYVLSAFAGVVYILATAALALNRRRLALVTIGIELVGVLAVGIVSLVDEGLFPDETVWSDFGRGYGFVPLVLPFIGLWWLRRTRTAHQA
ncbi:hypothetical protein [Aeromicrobium wangtongii]|uniref:Integral membrane protein n=1 Tax=Aeromicrobium wangtongii TaxID=2969247 RepID=A0ABY5M568_9ACTN|nr:hypothetical protein [Aeromicrobium wangtongii]MCD9198099.1 hypothetical protein [Aeromicrobium wangtongii]UUP12138.1 hypothetical protein NQV15_09725 [Aeromicrobium wangtongii]